MSPHDVDAEQNPMKTADLGDLRSITRQEWDDDRHGYRQTSDLGEFQAEWEARHRRPRCWYRGCEAEAHVIGFVGAWESIRMYLACREHRAADETYWVELYDGPMSLCNDLPGRLLHLGEKTTGHLQLLLTWLGTQQARQVLVGAAARDGGKAEPLSHEPSIGDETTC